MNSLVIEEGKYCRSVNSCRIKLQQELLQGYKREKYDCRIFPSGMAAIACLMDVISKKDGLQGTFILGNELYCDTPRVVKNLQRFNPHLNCETFDVRDYSALTKIFDTFKNTIKLLFLETCSNPSGQMFDFSKVREIKKKYRNCLICVDNTWTGYFSFNPFDYGVDVVVESLTKYVSAGRCIGGALIGPKQLVVDIAQWVAVYGQFVGKDHCAIFLEGLSNLEERIAKTSMLALQVAKTLETQSGVNRVMYPMLESHPTWQLAEKYLQRNPGIIWFHVSVKAGIDIDKKKCRELLENTFIRYETSYGSPWSKFDCWPRAGFSTDYEFPQKENEQYGLWIRLSIGYSDTFENIMNGIHELLEKFENIAEN